MEAAMKIAEASNSFSPCRLLNRPLARIHISRGMLKIRISVMELGRFTRLGGSGGQPESSFDYAPRKEGTQWKGDLLQRRSSLRLCRVQQPSSWRQRRCKQCLYRGDYFGAGAIAPALGCLAMIRSLTVS